MLNSAGAQQWSSLYGSSVSDLAQSVAMDSGDNIIVAGSTKGDLGGTYVGGQGDGCGDRLFKNTPFSRGVRIEFQWFPFQTGSVHPSVEKKSLC